MKYSENSPLADYLATLDRTMPVPPSDAKVLDRILVPSIAGTFDVLLSLSESTTTTLLERMAHDVCDIYQPFYTNKGNLDRRRLSTFQTTLDNALLDINDVYIPLFLAKADIIIPGAANLSDFLATVPFHAIMDITNNILGGQVSKEDLGNTSTEQIQAELLPDMDQNIPYYQQLAQQLIAHLACSSTLNPDDNTPIILTTAIVSHATWLHREPHMHNAKNANLARGEQSKRFDPIMFQSFQDMTILQYAKEREDGKSPLNSLIQTAMLIFKDITVNE